MVQVPAALPEVYVLQEWNYRRCWKPVLRYTRVGGQDQKNRGQSRSELKCTGKVYVGLS